jgi:hypothetical protein
MMSDGGDLATFVAHGASAGTGTGKSTKDRHAE